MNIEFIKSEIKRLSLIVESWSEGNVIPAVERDLALDKIKSLYDVLRFGESQGVVAEPTATVIPPVVENKLEDTTEAEEPEEKDVEVEFIFAEEDEEDEPNSVEEVSADEESVAEPAPAAETVIKIDMAETEVAEKPEPEEPKVEPQPVKEETPVVEEVKVEKKAPAAEKPKPVASLNSLFGADEPRREPRSKHQRMMSIYNNESKPEKVVDISKIFDMDDEDDVEITAIPTPKPQSRVSKVVELDDEPIVATNTLADAKTVTLADAMAQNSTTLADTIAAPAALGEEINNSHIKSLRKAIGINDKFLMIRDLFGGDGDVYEQTLDALDEFDSFDDCLLYIAENHPEWNPDSEGAKFLTQLLERKLL
ncbi:MAG: hypothetical protein IIW60_08220 [Alistipes sp.]|nr:hypothetical protein [Alistipes sp.]